MEVNDVNICAVNCSNKLDITTFGRKKPHILIVSRHQVVQDGTCFACLIQLIRFGLPLGNLQFTYALALTSRCFVHSYLIIMSSKFYRQISRLPTDTISIGHCSMDMQYQALIGPRHRFYQRDFVIAIINSRNELCDKIVYNLNTTTSIAAHALVSRITIHM